jgi:cytochrome c oxidase subunit 2
MPFAPRPHRPAAVALSVAAVLAIPLALAACDVKSYPNSTFLPHSEFGQAIDDLWNLLLQLGTVVFIFVEGLLVYTIIKYRRRPGAEPPRHVHGNTTLEILWTVIPAVILVFIAVPTVKTIFKTEARASADALQVEVYGHQWWWEFRYPQYGVTTANELYLPIGRKVNFALRTQDVLHSFWIPQLGGKRDLISNHTNYLWFTPDSSMSTSAWNGTCNEYCGTSHGNMRFRVFVVPGADFARWATHQAGPAVFGVTAAAPTPPVAAPAPTPAPKRGAAARTAAGSSASGGGLVHPVAAVVNAAGQPAAAPATDAPTIVQGGAQSASEGDVFPRDSLRPYNIPSTPTPDGLAFTPGLVGDPARGQKVYSISACIGCHTIKGNPSSVGITGPNLTHIGSRFTIAAGTYPNDTEHLRLWIKNARLMKPGVLMLTLGLNQIDPQTGAKVTVGGLTDQQIADIAAYLQALK